MSVRRLADDAIQPESFAFDRGNMNVVKDWIKKYPKGRQASAVIPLLMIAQEQDGWVTKASIEHVAEMLEMPFIRVLEVATFYTQFQLQPVGTKAHIQVCGTTPCMLRGSHELMKVCQRKINENQFDTNANGTLSWEEVECQGACVNAPMVMIFKDTYEDLTPERLEEIIDAFERGEGDDVIPGPQIGRHFSAPVGGATTLLEDPVVKKSVRVGGSGRSVSAKTASAKSPAAGKSGAKSAAGEKLAMSAAADKSAPGQMNSPINSGSSKATVSGKTSGSDVVLDDKNRPAAINKPVDPDDLKLISGIGPKLESVLHGLGIFKFEQIAGWKKAERDWVDGYLKFKGRIERDNWIKQAKEFAKTRNS